MNVVEAEPKMIGINAERFVFQRRRNIPGGGGGPACSRGEANRASSGDALVVSEHTAKRFAADNLLALGEQLALVKPGPAEWSVGQSLMRADGVVKLA